MKEPDPVGADHDGARTDPAEVSWRSILRRELEAPDGLYTYVCSGVAILTGIITSVLPVAAYLTISEGDYEPQLFPDTIRIASFGLLMVALGYALRGLLKRHDPGVLRRSTARTAASFGAGVALMILFGILTD